MDPLNRHRSATLHGDGEICAVLVEDGESPRGEEARRTLGDIAFQDAPKSEYRVKVLDVHRRDLGSAPASEDDEAAALEPTKGFADGHVADTEKRTEILDRHVLTGRQAPVEHPRQHRLGDLLDDRLRRHDRAGSSIQCHWANHIYRPLASRCRLYSTRLGDVEERVIL